MILTLIGLLDCASSQQKRFDKGKRCVEEEEA